MASKEIGSDLQSGMIRISALTNPLNIFLEGIMKEALEDNEGEPASEDGYYQLLHSRYKMESGP